METESKYKCGRAEEVVEYKTVITRIVDQSRDLGYLRELYIRLQLHIRIIAKEQVISLLPN